ncbi:hypothetical protein [Nonomuraea endophytica]|uniref:hypothetical protein n=1 Tax=Nonomuraea endophytica TaxID=714136 RepID=UPI0037CB0B82
MKWDIAVFDSANTNVNIRLTNSGLSNSGTWVALNPGMLLMSEGHFNSDVHGVNLMAPHPNHPDPVSVVQLFNLWWIGGTWANNSGSASINQPTSLMQLGSGTWQLS